MLQLEKPSLEQIKEIYAELNTNEENLQIDIQQIQDWFLKQPHLPNYIDKDRLKHTLVFCKNSLEKTKFTLDMYYSFRTLVPEFYSERDPENPELLASMSVAIFLPMPRLTPDGYRVSIFKFFDPDVSKFDINNMIKVSFMSIDIRIQEDLCKGDILVYDFEGGSMGHMTSTLPLLKKIIYCGTSAMPMRQKSVHIINLPSYAQSFVQMANSFLKKKLAQRVYVHSNGYEGLKDFIQDNVLPADCGGSENLTLIEIKEGWIEKLRSYREWFLKENLIKSDESKRLGNKPNNLTNNSEIIGIEGSFRKINLD